MCCCDLKHVEMLFYIHKLVIRGQHQANMSVAILAQGIVLVCCLKQLCNWHRAAVVHEICLVRGVGNGLTIGSSGFITGRLELASFFLLMSIMYVRGRASYFYCHDCQRLKFNSTNQTWFAGCRTLGEDDKFYYNLLTDWGRVTRCTNCGVDFSIWEELPGTGFVSVSGTRVRKCAVCHGSDAEIITR